MESITYEQAKQELFRDEQQGFYTLSGKLFWREQLQGVELMRMYHTGWTCNGYPIIAGTVLRVNPDHPFDGSGDYSNMRLSFNIPDRRGDSYLTDITRQLINGQLYLQDCNGNYGEFNQAYNALKRLAFISSLFPHVLMCDEFLKLEEELSSYYGYQKPDVTYYLNTYLPTVEEDIRTGRALYVGQITRYSDLQRAYDSAKSYTNQPQGRMNNYQGDTSRQQNSDQIRRNQPSESGIYYRNMQKNGFSIYLVTEEIDYNDHIIRTSFISTPWHCQGRSVEVFASIDCDEEKVKSIFYNEITRRDDDIDITNRLYKGRIFLFDTSERMIDIDQADSLIIEMIRKTMKLPNVLSINDYMNLERRLAIRDGKPAPTVSTYLNYYIPLMTKQLKDPSNVFIGWITNSADIIKAIDEANQY